MVLKRKIGEITSFRTRLCLTLVPIFCALFVILGIVDHYEQKRLAEDELNERAKSMVENLAYSSRLAVLTEDKLLLDSALQSVTDTGDFAYVWIYGARWTPLAVLGAEKIDLKTIPGEITTEQLTRLTQKREVISSTVAMTGRRYLEYLAPIASAQTGVPYELQFDSERPATGYRQGPPQTIGAVRLGLSMNRVDAHLTSFLKWRGWSLAAFLCLSALAIYAFSVQVTRPVKQLTDQAKKMTLGHLNQRIPVESHDEIGQLAATFNEMAGSLHDLYSSLERKVAERTQELTTANQKLAEASAQKSHFLASVNHELRTPVSAIIGYARLLRRETEGQISHLQQDNLGDLLKNAERLLNLIDSLLDVAKIEAGKMEIKLETVNVDEVITGAISIIAPSLENRALCLVKEIGPDLPTLDTDREKFRQIVLNLLENAVKFTPSGQITVSAQAHHGNLQLVVSDTGVGIAKEDLPNLFEEFYRGKSATRGTGLGLAITHQLVNILGGEITVESAMGEGSSFTLTLPLKQSRPFAINSERLAS